MFLLNNERDNVSKWILFLKEMKQALRRYIYWIKRDLRRCWKNIKYREIVHYGNLNRDKKFLVITSPGEAGGLYSTLFYWLEYLDYAKKKGYIPVIDIKNTFVPLMQDTAKKGIENAWEYYYEQPNNEYSLADVYKSRYVVRMNEYMVDLKKSTLNQLPPIDNEELVYWNKVICTYIRPNQCMLEKIQDAEDRVFEKGKKVLGVGIRAEFRWGSLLNYASVNGHPIVRTYEEYIRIVEERMQDWGCDYIFLACDDREYWSAFVEYFGNKCKYYPRVLRHYFTNGIPNVRGDEAHFVEYGDSTVRARTEEYMVETYILSKCDSLYSCIGGGSQFAYFANGGKYEHLEFDNQGVYNKLTQG